MKRPVYLALGSNIGDCRANILKAVELLDAQLGPHIRLSHFYESKAEGFVGPDFVNAAVRYDTDLDPHSILCICKDVEKQIGRDREGIELDNEGRRIYHSRIIDIDVLLVGDVTENTPELTIPHPRMKEREFVMVPLREIFEGIS